MTMGGVDYFAATYGYCPDCNQSDSYYQGQQAGRFLSTAAATVQEVQGAAMAGAALAAIHPTATGGAGCTALTGGACAVPAGVVVVGEAGLVVAGTAEGVYGANVIAYNKSNSIRKGGFRGRGIRTVEHFWDRLRQYGWNEDQALDVYQNGKQYFNQFSQNVRWNPKSGLTLIIDSDDGSIITIEYNAKPMKNWERGWITPEPK
jgi:hypothetical protein